MFDQINCFMTSLLRILTAHYIIEVRIYIDSIVSLHQSINQSLCVDIDVDGKLIVKNPLFNKRPCIYAGGYYSEFLQLNLWKNVDRNSTLVMASEELEADPIAIWNKVSYRLGINVPIFHADSQESPPNDLPYFNVGNFSKIRYNTQDNRGTTASIPIQK